MFTGEVRRAAAVSVRPQNSTSRGGFAEQTIPEVSGSGSKSIARKSVFILVHIHSRHGSGYLLNFPRLITLGGGTFAAELAVNDSIVSSQSQRSYPA